MLKLVANAAALSLMLSASVSTPAWSAGERAPHANCPKSKHHHAKRSPAAVRKPQAQGVMLVDQRKRDVQILSFGP